MTFEGVVLYSGLCALAIAFIMVFIDVSLNFDQKYIKTQWYYRYKGLGGYLLMYFLLCLVVHTGFEITKLFK